MVFIVVVSFGGPTILVDFAVDVVVKVRLGKDVILHTVCKRVVVESCSIHNEGRSNRHVELVVRKRPTLLRIQHTWSDEHGCGSDIEDRSNRLVGSEV